MVGTHPTHRMLGSNLDTAYVAHTRELYDIFECEPDLRRGDVYTTTPFFIFFVGRRNKWDGLYTYMYIKKLGCTTSKFTTYSSPQSFKIDANKAQPSLPLCIWLWFLTLFYDVAEGGSNPVWNEKFVFRVEYPGSGQQYKLILKSWTRMYFLQMILLARPCKTPIPS